MMELNIGDIAPNFSGKDQNGNQISLADYKGKKVALYFYPKDDTPGCTKQACNLRDNYAKLQDANYVILGVSADDEASHQKFITKYDLPFPLLADTEKEIITAYGVWKEKNMYGNKKWGIARTTFLIDEEGKIVHIFKRPKTAEHTEEILAKS